MTRSPSATSFEYPAAAQPSSKTARPEPSSPWKAPIPDHASAPPEPTEQEHVEQAYSQGLVLPFAAIRNHAGNYVLPSTQTIAAAAAQKPDITPTDFSIVNQPGTSSYPISGYSWALIYTRQPSQATGQALVTMLDWLTHDGQAYAAANLYVPLPAQVRQLARSMLQQVTGPTGTHLAS